MITKAQLLQRLLYMHSLAYEMTGGYQDPLAMRVQLTETKKLFRELIIAAKLRSSPFIMNDRVAKQKKTKRVSCK